LNLGQQRAHDAAAFETHKQASDHIEFNEATGGMSTAKSVRLLQKINH